MQTKQTIQDIFATLNEPPNTHDTKMQGWAPTITPKEKRELRLLNHANKQSVETLNYTFF